MQDNPTTRLLRPAQVAVVAAVMLLIGASGASAATTLAGETLTSPFDALSITNNPTCVGSGPFTFNFSTSGAATGPVVGHFKESGSFTLASANGPLTSFAANFTITSTGQPNVTGTKTLVSSTAASCVPHPGGPTATFTAVTHYSATSPFTEAGTAPLSFDFGLGTQTFVEGPFVVGLAAPTSKGDCMNGGFSNFTDPSTGAPFKNQGQCIKFVNHEP
jgi:hypothetical protein